MLEQQENQTQEEVDETRSKAPSRSAWQIYVNGAKDKASDMINEEKQIEQERLINSID